MIHLDTHVLLWLYEKGEAALGKTGRRLVEQHPILVSPAVMLELEMLHEIGRMRVGATQVIESLNSTFGLQICDLPFQSTMVHALREGWTRDPFDRLIVANAKAAKAALVSKDQIILKNYSRAVW